MIVVHIVIDKSVLTNCQSFYKIILSTNAGEDYIGFSLYFLECCCKRALHVFSLEHLSQSQAGTVGVAVMICIDACPALSTILLPQQGQLSRVSLLLRL